MPDEKIENDEPWKTLCVECGPNVAITEDGCCAMCGATATGRWLALWQARSSDVRPNRQSGGGNLGDKAKAFESRTKQEGQCLLTEAEAAAVLGFGRRWLQSKRLAGIGPDFVQWGPRAIRYRHEDVLKWAADNLVRKSN